MVDIASHAGTTIIEREMIDRLPKGRDFTSLVAAATPGTNAEPRTSGLQVDGASGAENRFLVNGIDTTHLVTGTSDKEAIVDFLQEVQVVSNGFSAEHRVANGGLITAVTKSGTNDWRGMVGTYYDGSAFLAGHPRAELRLDPADGVTPQYVTPREDTNNTWEPLGEIGGPVVHDRLWAYGAYSLRRRSHARDVQFMENGESGSFDSVTKEHNLYSAVTARLSSSAHLRFASVNEHDGGGVELPSVDTDGASFDNPSLFPSRIHTDRGSQLFSLDVQWLAAGRLAVSLTGGAFTSGARTRNAYTGYRRVFALPNFQFDDIPEPLQHGTGYADAPRPFVTLQDDLSRQTLHVNATGTVHHFGWHTLSMGLQFERFANIYDAGDQSPTITLVWDRSTAQFGDPARGTYGYYHVRQNQYSGDVADASLGVYLQDRWRATARLTIDAGVRVDREELPSYRPENPGLEFGFGEKVAPRLGFAWDPTGTGRSKLYGSWGAFFDIMKLEMPRDFFGAQHFLDSFLPLDTYDWPSITCASPPAPGPTCPGSLIGTIDFRPPLNAPDDNGRPSIVDPALRPMRTHEFILGVDRQIGASWVTGIRYVQKRLDRAIEDVGTLTPDADFTYRVANPGYGLARQPYGPDVPPLPRARRDYDALEFTVQRRLAERWALNASYTLSRLWGNYSGLANSDEELAFPNVEIGFDTPHGLFDASGRPVIGRLATDRPNVVKVQGTYDARWGTTFGVNVFLGSGTPLQRYLLAGDVDIPMFYAGRLSDGRTPTLRVVDLMARHSFQLPRHQALQLELTALNLFDRASATGFDMSRFQDGFGGVVSNSEFFSGWNPESVAEAYGILHNPSFGMANSFQEPRQVRVAVRLRF